MKRWINLRPSSTSAVMLGMLPFVVLAIIYIVASGERLAANPADKLLPSLSRFVDAINQMAFKEDLRSGKVLLWSDTAASLSRLLSAVGISATAGLIFGILTGLLPYARTILSPLVTAVSLVPPLAILPILFIVFGIDEFSKIMLIVIGITPVIIRDLAMQIEALPREQLIKAQTLGANTWQIVLRIALPQMLPRLIDAVRLSLGAAWLFLIAAEAVAAQSGLGYRIFLVRRYMSMDIILPYVAWITFLAFATDFSLKMLGRWLFPWTRKGL